MFWESEHPLGGSSPKPPARPRKLHPRRMKTSKTPRPSLTARSLGCVLLLAAIALGSAACSKTYISNTDVPDSAENRRIISFCEKYRRAVEQRNVAMLLQMASPAYYEDGGNVDASDDLDYAGLREYLTSTFQDVSAIRYEIRYRRVIEEENVVYVDYTYSASYRIPSGKGSEWRRKVEENRLELVRAGDDFRIVAGM